jgi:hypothetical protein
MYYKIIVSKIDGREIKLPAIIADKLISSGRFSLAMTEAKRGRKKLDNE